MEVEEGITSGGLCVPGQWGYTTPLPPTAPHPPQWHTTIMTFTQMCAQPARGRADPAEGGHRWCPFRIREGPALPWLGTPDRPHSWADLAQSLLVDNGYKPTLYVST